MPENIPNPADPTARGILLVEEYDALGIAISSALRKFAPHHGVQVAQTFAEAEAAAATMRPELFVLDLDPPPRGEIEFLNRLQVRYPEARVLVIAAGTSRELRAERGTAGAVQFIEKPFDLTEFGGAVQALVGPWAVPPSSSFRGRLRDLHVVDIVQLKCLALSTAVVRLETPAGEIGEIHFRHGEIFHAATGELTGIPALEEIVRWPGGRLSEAEVPEHAPRTIEQQPWAVLLLDVVRRVAENEGAKSLGADPSPLAEPGKASKTILVIDDTEMLLIFAADVLATADRTFKVITASTGEEGLKLAAMAQPDLVLLDYSLTNMNGDEVCRGLLANETTARIPVLMMSGHLPELTNTAERYGNVVATLPKPFLSGALINAVEKILARGPLASAPPPPPLAKPESPPVTVTDPLHQPSPNGHAAGTKGGIATAPSSAPALVVATSETTAPPAPTIPVAARPREVSVTFAFDAVSVQLTPDYRLDALQLRPAEDTVAARMSAAGDVAGLPAEIGFRLEEVGLGVDGLIDTMRLIPTQQPLHLAASGNAFAVARVGAQPEDATHYLELTAAKSAVMRVQLTAQFQIVRVELSDSFQTAAVVLRSSGTGARVGTSSGSAPALFEVQQVQIDDDGKLTHLFVRAKR